MSLLLSDVVIVGNELSGLAAGALLAHEGLKVSWLGKEPNEAIQLGEFLVPKTMDIWQLNPQPGEQDIFRDLALRQELRRELEGPLELGLLGDPQERLCLSPDPQARALELRRAFGEDAETLLQKLTNWPKEALNLWLTESTFLHQQGFWANRKRKKRLQGAQPEHGAVERFSENMDALGLRYMLTQLRLFLQWTDHPSWRPLGLVDAARSLLEGAYVPRNSQMSCRDALAQIFIQTIKRRGGSVHPGLEIKSIETSGKKIQRVSTNGGHEFGGRLFVDATLDRSFSPKVNNVPMANILHAEEDAVPMSRDVAVVRWLLPREVIPRGLPKQSVHVVEGDGSLEAVHLGVFSNLTVSTEAKVEKELARRFVAVVAQSPCPLNRAAHTAIELEVFLDQFLPFAKERVVAQDSLLPNKVGPLMPGYDLAPANLPFMGRPIRTGIRNCLRAGRDLAPGLGINGELHASYAICNYVAKKAGPKKSIFREPPPT